MKHGLFLSLAIALACGSHAVGQDKALRAPRRLSQPQKKQLAACLAAKPGRFSITSIAGDTEAYAYAQDWREVFESAGWKIEQQNGSVFRIAGVKWSGMRASAHNNSPDEGQMVLAADSPEWNFERCVAGKHDIPPGGRIRAYKDRPTGLVSVQVSIQQQ